MDWSALTHHVVNPILAAIAAPRPRMVCQRDDRDNGAWKVIAVHNTTTVEPDTVLSTEQIHKYVVHGDIHVELRSRDHTV